MNSCIGCDELGQRLWIMGVPNLLSVTSIREHIVSHGSTSAIDSRLHEAQPNKLTGAHRRAKARRCASELSDGLGPTHQPLAVNQLIVGVIQILYAPARDITTFHK